MKYVSIVVVLALVAVLAQYGAQHGDAMPQAVSGDDVLSVAFGDAKETISRAMVHKADSYFHGGVDMECSMDHEHEQEECSEHSHHDCAHDHHDEDLDDHAHEQARSGISSFDPWRWINTRIRAPEVDQHLDKDHIVEMMPWFWAAVKADPHNIEAWTTAFYMATNGMKDDSLAQEVLKEAKRANPDSLEILLAEGRYLYKKGEGDVDAAEKVFLSIRDLALSRSGNDVEKLEENDRWMYKFSLNYLKDIEKKRQGE